MVRVCTKAGESQSHLWYYKAAKLTLKMRRGCACWLMHTEKRRKILKAPFCHSRHNLAQLVLSLKEHGARPFNGLPLGAKPNINNI